MSPFSFSNALRVYGRVVFWPFRLSIGALTLLSGLAASMSLVGIGSLLPIVAALVGTPEGANNAFTRFVGSIAQGWGISLSPRGYVFALLLLACAALVARGGILLLNQAVTYHLAIKAWHSVYRRMFLAFLKAEFFVLAQRRKGEILQDIQSASLALSEVTAHTSKGLVATLELIVLSGFVFYLSGWAAGLFFGLAGLGAYANRRAILGRADRYNRRAYELQQRATAWISEALDGVRIVKIGNVAERWVGRLKELLTLQRRVGIRYGVLAEMPSVFTELFIILPLLAVVALSLSHPSLALPPATLAGIVIAVTRMKLPLQTLSQAMVLLAANLRKVEVVEETLQGIPLESAKGPLVSLPPRVESVTLEEVGFSYPGASARPPVLDRVNLCFRRGEVTALVGPTGSGKTTLADLLALLFTPQQGVIQANGVDISRVDLTAWRQRIGYVGQDPFLFNATLKENITLWDPSVSEEQMDFSIRTAQMEEFVAKLPEGLEAVVGDRGVKLSGGMRQRVAIARAILHRPEILIFDEATSALDNVTEQAIRTAIDRLKAEAIVVLIAHRLSTVRQADRIVVLDRGRIAEMGTHEDLMNRQGIYWRLYRLESSPEGRGAPSLAPVL